MTFSRPWLCTSALVLAALLAGLAAPTTGQDKPSPIRALLVIGGCCHDYVKQKDILTKGISQRANVTWTIAYDPDTSTTHMNPIYDNPNWAKGYDVVVHDECSSGVKDPEVINRILEPHRQGLPGVVVHCGMHSYRGEGYDKGLTKWYEFTGLQTNAHKAQMPIAVTYVDSTNPITKELSDWTTIKEELYNNFSGKLMPTAQPLARGKQTIRPKKGKETTDDFVVAWTNTYMGKARVFGTTLGHNNQTVADPRYLDLVTRGLLWAVDKLDAAHVRPPSRALPK